MPTIKRANSEVQCGSCGKTFKQSRWWQVFCSRDCKKSVERIAKARVKVLEEELRICKDEKGRLSEALDNALAHIRALERGQGTSNGGYRYDDDNQEYWR